MPEPKPVPVSVIQQPIVRKYCGVEVKNTYGKAPKKLGLGDRSYNSASNYHLK